jgi:anaerobic magnesium-protoporphyrin IX monomethyl ester cyclase
MGIVSASGGKMRVLFVCPNWNKHTGFWCSCQECHQPLEYLYPATLLKNRHEVQILDLQSLNLDNKQAIPRINEFSPDAVILNTTQSYLSWRCCPTDIELPKKLARQIRRSVKTKMIVIGPHASVSPEYILQELDADYVISGEPELALAEFINSGMKNLKIKGLAGKGFSNGLAKVHDLSKLPAIDFSLVSDYSYHAHYDTKYPKGAIIEFSRGCIFKCSFCFRQKFREEYRERPVEKVIAEIRQLRQSGIEYVYFIDELFNKPTPQFYELLRQMKKLDIRFGCESRPDVMTKQTLRLMKQAGCEMVEYGIESLNNQVLEKLSKNLNIKTVKDIINNTADMGIQTKLLLMYGFPNETKKTLKNTRQLLLGMDNRVEIDGSPIAIYPTTPLYEEVFGKPGKIGKKEWETTLTRTGRICPVPKKYIWALVSKTYWDQKIRRLGVPIRLVPFVTDIISPFIIMKKKIFGK